MRRAPSPAFPWILGALAAVVAGCTPAAPPSLLLISVDTLRADRLGAYGSPLGLTPALDALAAESVVFEASFAPTSFTRPSVSALLTGRYPEETGVVSNRAPLPEGIPTLASLLRERGYRTGAVVSNSILVAEAGLQRGFEVYDDRLEEHELVRHVAERSAPRTSDAALAWLAGGAGDPRPFFLWVHYQDPHGPYTPPEEYRAAYLGSERRAEDPPELPLGSDNSGRHSLPLYQAIGSRRDPAFYRAGYDGEIRLADEAIGRLLGGVARQVPSRSLIIAFTADHGEGLGEGGLWFAHGGSLVDPLVRVPLLLRVPGRAPARRAEVASLVDLLPTLLAACGVEPPPGLLGRNLLDPAALARPALAYFHALEPIPGHWVDHWGAARGGDRYYAVARDGQRGEVARSQGREVPLESASIAALRESAAGLRREIARRREAAPAPEPQPLGPAEQRRLEALGYADPPTPPPPTPTPPPE